MTVDQHIFLNISKYENVGYNKKWQNFDKSNEVKLPDELTKEEEEGLVNNNNGMLMANDNEAMS